MDAEHVESRAVSLGVARRGRKKVVGYGALHGESGTQVGLGCLDQ